MRTPHPSLHAHSQVTLRIHPRSCSLSPPPFPYNHLLIPHFVRMKLLLSQLIIHPQTFPPRASPTTNRTFTPISIQQHAKQTYNSQHGGPPLVFGALNAKRGVSHFHLHLNTTTMTKSNSIRTHSRVASTVTDDWMELSLHSPHSALSSGTPQTRTKPFPTPFPPLATSWHCYHHSSLTPKSTGASTSLSTLTDQTAAYLSCPHFTTSISAQQTLRIPPQIPKQVLSQLIPHPPLKMNTTNNHHTSYSTLTCHHPTQKKQPIRHNLLGVLLMPRPTRMSSPQTAFPHNHNQPKSLTHNTIPLLFLPSTLLLHAQPPSCLPPYSLTLPTPTPPPSPRLSPHSHLPPPKHPSQTHRTLAAR